jgi:hypothetical protein
VIERRSPARFFAKAGLKSHRPRGFRGAGAVTYFPDLGLEISMLRHVSSGVSLLAVMPCSAIALGREPTCRHFDAFADWSEFTTSAGR